MIRSLKGLLICSSICVALQVFNINGARAQYIDGTTEWIVNNAWLDFNSNGWTYESPWYWESAGSGQNGFNTSTNNTIGTYKASYETVDLTTLSGVTSLTNYSPSTAYLYDFDLFDPWREAYWGTLPSDGDYELYLELVIDTVAGPDFTATSQKIGRSTFAVNSAGQFGFNLTWDTDPFTGLGVPLSNINDITYSVVMDVNTPTTSGDGWLQMQGFNLRARVATVESVPEPASLLLIGFGGILLLSRRSTIALRGVA